jgi:cytochrome c2
MTLDRIRAAICVLPGILMLASACERQSPDGPQSGQWDPGAGRAAIEKFGCNTCHVIPGVSGPRGLVGPPLTAWSRRVYIAGEFPNEPATLVRWIIDPPALVPGTAMPAIGVSEMDARNIAAYLYTLE